MRFSNASTSVSALPDDSPDLLAGDIAYNGELEYDPGDPEAQQRTVFLELNEEISWSVFDWFGDDIASREWDIGLTRNVPLTLELGGGYGDTSLDLRGLRLTSLDMTAGLGNATVWLPAAPEAYTASVGSATGDLDMYVEEGARVENLEIDVGSSDVLLDIEEAAAVDATLETGSGDLDITLEEDTTASLMIEADSGDVELAVPESSAVRLEARTDSGDIDVPRRFEQVSGNDEEGGIWQTPGFDEADEQITIVFESDSGDLELD
jgi:hypothetical protein